jgi:hypothetical protein
MVGNGRENGESQHGISQIDTDRSFTYEFSVEWPCGWDYATGWGSLNVGNLYSFIQQNGFAVKAQ